MCFKDSRTGFIIWHTFVYITANHFIQKYISKTEIGCTSILANTPHIQSQSTAFPPISFTMATPENHVLGPHLSYRYTAGRTPQPPYPRQHFHPPAPAGPACRASRYIVVHSYCTKFCEKGNHDWIMLLAPTVLFSAINADSNRCFEMPCNENRRQSAVLKKRVKFLQP